MHILIEEAVSILPCSPVVWFGFHSALTFWFLWCPRCDDCCNICSFRWEPLCREHVQAISHCHAAVAGPGTSLLHTHPLRIQELFSYWALVVAVRVRTSYQKIFIALILITAGQQCWHDDFQLFVFVKQVNVITRQACEENWERRRHVLLMCFGFAYL